jgi:hypothetical protein
MKRAYRNLLVALVATPAAFAFVPDQAGAQNAAWCAYNRQGSNICAFSSYKQCMDYLSGIGGICSPNLSAKAGPAKPDTANAERITPDKTKTDTAKAEKAARLKAERVKAERRQAAEKEQAAVQRKEKNRVEARQEMQPPVITREPALPSIRPAAVSPTQSSAAAPFAASTDAISEPVTVRTRANQ